MVFDNRNLKINRGLPTWFNDNVFFAPIEKYSQEFTLDAIDKLFEPLGVIQPIQLWKNLPNDYNWVHVFKNGDERLDSFLKFNGNNKVNISLPLTQRPLDFKITIKFKPLPETPTDIGYIKLSNNNSEMKISGIKNFDEIEYNSRTKEVKVLNRSEYLEVDNFIEKIFPTAINEVDNYDLFNRNAENILTLSSSGEEIEFDLVVELFEPVYIIDQNIRLWSISALPIKKVEVFGFFIHEFNTNQGWKMIFEKEYSLRERVVYDRFSMQYDTEIFYIKVYYHGLDYPILKGFPQEVDSPNAIFNINKNIDKWGEIYGLKRQYYREDINDESKTFPPYYLYPVEQDYWYEKRLINEYRWNEDNIDGVFVKDTNNENIAIIKAIDPYVEDLWVFTETIPHKPSQITTTIDPSFIDQNGRYTPFIDNDGRKTVFMEPLTSKSFQDEKNKSNQMVIGFDLSDIPDYTELHSFEFQIDIQSSLADQNIIFDERSNIRVPIRVNEDILWLTLEQNYQPNLKTYRTKYTIYDYEFKDPEHKINLSTLRDNGLELNIGFTNLHSDLIGEINIHDIKLILSYNISKKQVKLSSSIKNKIITNTSTELLLKISNTGEIPIYQEKIYIICPGLSVVFTDMIDIAIGETVNIPVEIIGNSNGYYDLSVFFLDQKNKHQIIVLKEE